MPRIFFLVASCSIRRKKHPVECTESNGWRKRVDIPVVDLSSISLRVMAMFLDARALIYEMVDIRNGEAPEEMKN